MKKYINDLRELLSNRIYIWSVIIISVISFGYAAFNSSISIDDTEYDRYVGSGNVMLSAGRFGIWFWSFIEGRWENSFLIDVVAVFLFIFACLNFCVLFKRVSDNKIGMGALTVFSCLFISYPLMNEIWEYTGANVNICGSFFLVSLSLLMLHSFIHNKKTLLSYLSLGGTALLMMLVCAGYESVVPVYIFFVFAILALQIIYGEEKEKKFSNIIKQGLIYAGVLLAGLALRLIVHRIILAVLNIPAAINGATQILWKTATPKAIITQLFDDLFVKYIFRSVIYFPLLVFMLCGLAFLIMGIIACKKHGAILLFTGFGMLLSLVILPLIQGVCAPYRTCQVIAAFCAFTAMMLISCFPKGVSKTKTVLRICAISLCGLLCFYQASFLNFFLEINHRRSESEEVVVRQISYDLRSGFDQNKPVIFVGSHSLSPTYTEAVSISENSVRWNIYCRLCSKYYRLTGREFNMGALSRKLPESNINSVINWSITAFESQDAMPKLFAYYGCAYVAADFNTYWAPANEAAAEMPAYPEKGYIKDMGDYIIVNMQ
ncbi:MAG: glucosyltransferase domain-containing protein [Clostridia bacterium]|nr:glucosyltransferase domain-containing protein [Clostridia bacterium]